jgi:hypothetical protein
MKLGAGRLPESALVFSDIEDAPLSRNAADTATKPGTGLAPMRRTVWAARRFCVDAKWSPQ